ncbi:unnamed protein product [Amaranthus hypochondriacus]
MAITFEVGTQSVGRIQTRVINTVEDLDQSLAELVVCIQNKNQIDSNGGNRCVVGLDINHDFIPINPQKVYETVSILKLCFESTCLIIQLSFLKQLPYSLCNFLKLNWISFVGVGIKHCVESLEMSYGIKCRNAVDLRDLAESHKSNGKYKGYALIDLASLYFRSREDLRNLMLSSADVALSNWGVTTLSDRQMKSATLDAFACFYLGKHLLVEGPRLFFRYS